MKKRKRWEVGVGRGGGGEAEGAERAERAYGTKNKW